MGWYTVYWRNPKTRVFEAIPDVQLVTSYPGNKFLKLSKYNLGGDREEIDLE